MLANLCPCSFSSSSLPTRLLSLFVSFPRNRNGVRGRSATTGSSAAVSACGAALTATTDGYSDARGIRWVVAAVAVRLAQRVPFPVSAHAAVGELLPTGRPKENWQQQVWDHEPRNDCSSARLSQTHPLPSCESLLGVVPVLLLLLSIYLSGRPFYTGEARQSGRV